MEGIHVLPMKGITDTPKFSSAVNNMAKNAINKVKIIILLLLKWVSFVIELIVWVIPSLIFDIYVPVFVLIGGGGRFYNYHNPSKSLGFSRNIVLLEALKTFP